LGRKTASAGVDEKGLLMQFKQISEYVAEGRLKVETLADSCRLVPEKLSHDPASAVAALSDWKTKGINPFGQQQELQLNLYQEAESFGFATCIFLMKTMKNGIVIRYVLRIAYALTTAGHGRQPLSHGNIRAGIYPVVLIKMEVKPSLKCWSLLSPICVTDGLKPFGEWLQGSIQGFVREASVDIFMYRK
jgi:hypothetical protein